MPEAISNTSPLLYLYRIGAMDWLPKMFSAKAQGLTDKIEPLIGRLEDSGMWISEEVRQRILTLAGESD
ncbi:MAG: DUF3368 domain-containing protein [Chloroflexota bacterium]